MLSVLIVVSRFASTKSGRSNPVKESRKWEHSFKDRASLQDSWMSNRNPVRGEGDTTQYYTYRLNLAPELSISRYGASTSGWCNGSTSQEYSYSGKRARDRRKGPPSLVPFPPLRCPTPPSSEDIGSNPTRPMLFDENPSISRSVRKLSRPGKSVFCANINPRQESDGVDTSDTMPQHGS